MTQLLLDKSENILYNLKQEVISLQKIFTDESTRIRSIESVVYYKPGQNTFSDYSGVGKGICELIFKLSGETKVTYNGKSQIEKPGNVRFIPLKKDQRYIYTVECIEASDCIDVYFTVENELADEMVILDLSSNDKIKTLFKKLYGIWTSKEEGYYEMSMSIFYEIIANLRIKASDKYLPSYKYKKLEPALKYISENWSNVDFDYSMPPKLAGISYSYYKQLFVKRFGVVPSKYLLNLRIKNASEMLDAGIYSVGEVAEMTGFANIYYFSRCFKEQVGITPSEYAMRQKQMAK